MRVWSKLWPMSVTPEMIAACAYPTGALHLTPLEPIAFITEGVQIRRILDHIGVDSEPAHISPARAPPLWDDCGDTQMDDGAQIEPEREIQGFPRIRSLFQGAILRLVCLKGLISGDHVGDIKPSSSPRAICVHNYCFCSNWELLPMMSRF